MSRLDYVTISIVAICILAIGFLVFKMTDVFKGDQPNDKIEAPTNVEEEDDAVYDYEIDGNVDSTGAGAAKGSSSSDSSPASKPATSSATTDRAETSAATAPAEDDVVTKTTTNSSSKPSSPAASEKASAPEKTGKFMVLAGSFTKRAFADTQVRQLKKLGFNNAKVEMFDRGKYAVVLVDRFNNMAEAERLVKKLGTSDVKSYVKIKG